MVDGGKGGYGAYGAPGPLIVSFSFRLVQVLISPHPLFPPSPSSYTRLLHLPEDSSQSPFSSPIHPAKMRQKRAKSYRKLMSLYHINFGFRQPYQILVDADMCKAAIDNKMDLYKQLEMVLQGDVKPSE